MWNDLERRVFVQGIGASFSFEPGDSIDNEGIISTIRKLYPSVPADVRLAWVTKTDPDGTEYRSATVVPVAQSKG